MRICVNAGHTKFGIGTGAVGLLNESIETRHIAYELMKQLSDTSHEVIPAVFDKTEINLQQATTTANINDADLFISIHLNAGKGHGVETYTWKGNKTKRATQVVSNLSALGFTNRGVKDGSHLYVIKNTKCESMLIEVCFVDNEQDAKLYKNIGIAKVAKAIKDGILKGL